MPVTIVAVCRLQVAQLKQIISHRHPFGWLEAFLSDGRCLLVTERRMRNGATAGLRIDITRLKAIEAQLRETTESLDRVQRIAGIGSVERDLPDGHSYGRLALVQFSA
jgi:hypothetical protein